MRLSLLRAPLYPDPTADQGEHRFTVTLRPTATIAEDGSGDVIVRLYESLGTRATTGITAGVPAHRRDRDGPARTPPTDSCGAARRSPDVMPFRLATLRFVTPRFVR